MDFGTALRFVRECRLCHGFSSAQRDGYIADFDKFDTTGCGNLTNAEVLDLLRYMGFSVRRDEVYALMDQVDFNKNGAMEPDEFLMLMRLMTEKELALARRAFNATRGMAPTLPAKYVEDAILAVFEEHPPQREVLTQIL